MFGDILNQLQNADFSGLDGFAKLIAILIPVFIVIFLSMYKIVISLHHWRQYKRRLLGMIWRKKHSRKKITRKHRYYTIVFKWKVLFVLTIALAIIWPAYKGFLTYPSKEETINCYRPYIIDGDTLECNGTRIRLYSIDTPEMEGHCRAGRQCVEGDANAARKYLISLTRNKVTCLPINKDHYGRTVATCKSAKSENLSCDLLNSGHAILRYGNLNCN